MGSSLWMSAFFSREVSTQHHRAKLKFSPVRSVPRAIVETLENRLVLASAAGVENVLLPEFMGQMADPNDNQLPASDAWWALRSQRNMAMDEPISKVQNLAAHNAFNSLMEGFGITRFVSPNQILSLSGQLDFGARMLELDVHDPVDLVEFSTDKKLVLTHSGLPTFITRMFPYHIDEALDEIKGWLDRPENKNELIFLDIEDATDQAEDGADDPLIPHLVDHFGSEIYTPDERAIDERWPSRNELLARDKHVIFFTHRDDDQNGRFGVPTAHLDSDGHVWYGASIAFRANGGGDSVPDRGVYNQISIDDFDFQTAPSENADEFFGVQSDGIRNFSARRYENDDVARATALNVDFIKMDFLFGDDEDADLGSNVLPTNDPFYDIPEGNRVELFENAVWSWQRGDPAVDRQMFQDVLPGDGTGAAMFNLIADRLSLSAAQNLAQIGADARGNGRDVAVQGGGRFISFAPINAFPIPFAARSVLPDADGNYQWKLTTGTSTSWFDGYKMVNDEFGSGFTFAGPINGFENSQLTHLTGGTFAWLNVQDLDRDGNWTVGNRAPKITSVALQPASINEGQSAQLTVEFSDDPESHELQIDWGNGDPLTTVQVAAQAQQKVVVSHLYKDDNPSSGTPLDVLNIHVTLTDAGGLSDDATKQVTVNNVAPVIGAFASSATFANAAKEGAPVSILGSFTDVGVLDTHTAVVNWGDGSAPQTVTVNQGAGSGTVTGSHAYASGGIFTITLTVTDDDTGAKAATTTAVVTGVGVNNGVLFIIGSSDRDHVDLNQSGKGKLKVNADIIGKPREFDSASVQQIICYLGEGDDHLTIANQLNIPAVIHGGKGDDHLDAGGGPTVLLGDEGDDHLNGQGGRSILIGGVGKDELNAGSEEDVLIGATTNSDQNDAALMTAILTWNSPATYATRVALINGMFVVVDDGNVDKLEGGSGQDLFYNGVGDQLKGVKKDELILI